MKVKRILRNKIRCLFIVDVIKERRESSIVRGSIEEVTIMAEREIKGRRGLSKRQHPVVPVAPDNSPFYFGVHSDRNYPSRRTMEVFFDG